MIQFPSYRKPRKGFVKTDAFDDQYDAMLKPVTYNSTSTFIEAILRLVLKN